MIDIHTNAKELLFAFFFTFGILSLIYQLFKSFFTNGVIMNRIKREEMKRRQSMGEAAYNLMMEKQDMVRKLHQELFPEEYDECYDSIFESKLRRKGKNPMSQEYIDTSNNRRLKLKVEPYGITQNSPSAHKEAQMNKSYINSFLYCEMKVENHNAQS